MLIYGAAVGAVVTWFATTARYGASPEEVRTEREMLRGCESYRDRLHREHEECKQTLADERRAAQQK